MRAVKGIINRNGIKQIQALIEFISISKATPKTIKTEVKKLELELSSKDLPWCVRGPDFNP